MYDKGSYVSYGGHGICQISDIRPMDFGNGIGQQEYYVIQPIAPGSATIYLPAGNSNVQKKMRPVLTQEEIDSIIHSVKNDEMPWVLDRKLRLAQFHQVLSRRETRELLLLASCLHQRSMEKGLSGSELDILHRAEGIIEQEFAFSLQIGREKIGEYIQDKLK